MINSDLLSVFQDIVGVSKRIDTAISRYSSKDSSDEDFFIYHFFHRSFLFGKSILLLVDNQFFHEAVLVARNMMEGLFYFQAFRFEIISGLPKKWRLYALYEDYRMAKEEERPNLLNDYKSELRSGMVEEAQKEYDFGKRMENWFRMGSRRKLAEEIDKRLAERVGYGIGMVSLYDTLYSDFSQITHWTPRGIIIGQRNISAALAVCIQSLHTISEYVNKKYQLQFDGDLGSILANYFKIAHRELMRKISGEKSGISTNQTK